MRIDLVGRQAEHLRGLKAEAAAAQERYAAAVLAIAMASGLDGSVSVHLDGETHILVTPSQEA